MPALPYLVFASVCLINVILAQLVLPETKDHPLPEGLPARERPKKKDILRIDQKTADPLEENLI